MSTVSLASQPVPPASPEVRTVAPAWHTGLLVALFAGLAYAGARFQGHAAAAPLAPGAHPSVLPLYLSLIAAQVGLLAYVVRVGLARSGTPLSTLVGGRWATPRDVAVDAALGAGLWALWFGIAAAWDRVLGPGHAVSIGAYLPRGFVESLLWIGVSVSAGFVEEVVFRGYLQRQFAAWTRSPAIALVLSAAVFGIAHGYQGWMACARIAAFGSLFGALALWRRSLRPGMIGHALTDILGGLVRI